VRKKPLVCEPKEEIESKQQQQQTEEGKESTTIKAFQLSPKGPFHFSVEEGKRAKEDDTIITSDNTTTGKTTSTSIDSNLDSHRGENSHSKNNTTTEVASNNIQSDSANGGTTLPSSSATAAFSALMPPSQQQSMESKIQAGLFTNPLISESDLSIGGPYDPEIINNIDRVHPNSDRWLCYNCTLRDDKWGMMRHQCRHNKRKMKKEKNN
jgi:hypothetical protein